MMANSPSSDDYQRGYEEAASDYRRVLADVLRAHAQGPDALEMSRVREIFTLTFGPQACDEEFGPDPIVRLLDL
jgi:hypothetical protein